MQKDGLINGMKMLERAYLECVRERNAFLDKLKNATGDEYGRLKYENDLKQAKLHDLCIQIDAQTRKLNNHINMPLDRRNY